MNELIHAHSISGSCHELSRISGSCVSDSEGEEFSVICDLSSHSDGFSIESNGDDGSRSAR